MNGARDIHALGIAGCSSGVVMSLAAALCAVSFSCTGPRGQPSNSQSDDSFDAPIKTITVDGGPWAADIRQTLTCYYYSHVMIKEYDIGGSGAVGLSMLSSGAEQPACKPSRQPGERVIGPAEWEGYLKGVKETLVFFGPPDNFNGHSPFAVFDSVSGQKIFEDSEYGDVSSRLRVIATDDGYLLKYMRVADADCDLHLEGDACWQKIKAALSLKTDNMPACTGYDHIAELIGTDHVESVIAYPVEVKLLPQPTVEVVAGAAKCWAAQ